MAGLALGWAGAALGGGTLGGPCDVEDGCAAGCAGEGAGAAGCAALC
jgi:hypothetical protein